MCQNYLRFNPSVIETETLLETCVNAVAADDLTLRRLTYIIMSVNMQDERVALFMGRMI